MALVLADRVKDTTTTTGTGTVTLSGTAPTGYQNFAVIGNGNTTYYTIAGGSEWEVGIGTYATSGPTLARTTVLASTNGGSAVSFSSGTKDVFVTYPAERSANLDASSVLSVGTSAVLGTATGGSQGTGTINAQGYYLNGVNIGNVYTKTVFTATAAQTTFTVAYTVGYVDVYYNGSKLSTSEYTASTGTTVVLGTAATSGDIVEIIAWTVYSVTNTNIGIGTGTSLALGGATIGTNALAVTGTSTFSSTVTHSGATTLSGALTYGGVTLSNAVTGTGSMVLSAAPTLTGTLTAAAANFSGTVTATQGGANLLSVVNSASTADARIRLQNTGGSTDLGVDATGPYWQANTFSYVRTISPLTMLAALTYGGVTLSNAVTGTGNMVLSASPTLTGTLTAAAATFSGTLGVTGAATFNARISQALTPAAAEYALRSTGQTTGWIAIDMANTGGNYIVAGENSSGNNLIIGDSAYDMVIRGPSGISFSANAGAAQQMRLSSAGLLGIGMTPTVPLSVLGPVYATSAIAAFRGPNSGPCGIDFTVAAGMVASIKFDNTTTLTGNANSIQIVTGGGSISFAPNGTERGRFDTSGNLLVGTTSSLATTRFSVVGATNGIAVQCGNSGVGSYMTNTSGTGNWQPFSFCNTGTSFAQIGSITCTAAATAYNTSSDARLKTNVSDAAPASALIDAIQVRQFDWKVDNSHQRYGMVAQELLEVAPEAVSVPTDPEQMIGVDYSKLVPMLIKEVQSLRTRLAALEAK